MTLCLVYKTKCSDQSSDTIWDAIKNKLSSYSLHRDPSDICAKTWTSRLNQMLFHSICPDDRLKRVDGQKLNYTLSRVEKIEELIAMKPAVCFNGKMTLYAKRSRQIRFMSWAL